MPTATPAGAPPTFGPAFHIPIAIGLSGPHGEDLPLLIAGEGSTAGSGRTTRVLSLTDTEQQFAFDDLAAELGSPDVHVMATYGFTEAKVAWPECAGESSESRAAAR